MVVTVPSTDSLQKGWNDLNRRVENLDPNSSMSQLEDARRKLSNSLEGARTKADQDYQQAKLEIERLNAAEKLKQAEANLEAMRQSAKKVSDTAHDASEAIDKANAAYAKARAKYEAAKAKTEAYLRSAGL